jgi:hypothetical protein
VVVTENVAVVCPAATVTLAGTAAAVLLLPSVTTAPPVGATAVNVTVPSELVPPVTLVGLNDTEETVTGTATGLTVRVALPLLVPDVPVMVTVVTVVTAVVVTENVAVVWPAATVTLAGTAATAVLLLPRVTTNPPFGATPVNVTVPVEPAPPVTVDGLNDTVEIAAGFTVKVALPLLPL